MTGAVNYRLLVGLLLGVATVIRGHALHSNLLLSAGLGVLVALTVLYYKNTLYQLCFFAAVFSAVKNESNEQLVFRLSLFWSFWRSVLQKDFGTT